MSWRTKVVWSEGMLLQPQHLQQAERHADHARHVLLRGTTPYAWGFCELEIDAAALSLGKLALVRAVGVFGDGTVFDMPAVDPLFTSAIGVWQGAIMAVVLTGMGSDGMRGGKEIVAAGGSIIAQDEATSVVWGMPGSAVNAGICSAVLPLGQIAPKLNRLFSGDRS